ncbi:MAG TPA: hypothetical protein PLN52_07125 [Opitutaceae bacterium]|nr:hypothetical protein [Opitutaceae bacterium]
MRIAVQDANVLIDMELAGLFDPWFQVGIETHTTDLIRLELEKGRHEQALAYFSSNHIHEHRLSFDELHEIAELERDVGNKARFNDCSVLFLARKLDAMLLSCDKALRIAAEARYIEVHGTLWILDQLLENEVILPAVAAAKLDHLITLKRYLPKAECALRFKKWRS